VSSADERHELRRIQRRLDKARQSAYDLEYDRNALIRKSKLRAVDIAKATRLSRGRISQLRGDQPPEL